MASTKQQGMVFHQEGSTTPAAAPAGDHPPACFAVLKPGKASEGGMEQSTRLTNEGVDKMGKPNMYPSKEAIRTSAECPAMKHPTSSNPQSDNLSPDSICKGIRVTLDSNSMWNEFFRCKTEMILTKQGSRMFPYCRFRISGLQPSRKYSLIMDIQPLDNSRYKWTGKSWQVAGKAECHVKSQPFAHPESPSTGQHWMQNPVSFYKLKLTNNNTDQEGNTVLHPMHRYLPRLHVVQTDKLTSKDIKLNGPGVVTFTFPQTEFMAVTAYQNSRFAQLKVDYNPFTKGLKEDGSSSWGLKLKLNSGKVSHKDGDMTANEQHPFKKSLKSLLANHKPRSSKAVDSKPSVSGGLQQNSTTAFDQSAAKVNEEQSCTNSGPSQKLFSELIREAHVSLQRCNLEQLGMNNSTSHKNEETNTKATALKNNGQDVSKSENISVKTQCVMSPAKKGETVTKRKAMEDKEVLNSLDLQDIKKTDEVNNKVAAPALSQCKAEVQSEVKEKQHKRPAPLPLPALALFLKQHSSKSKKAKSKPEFPLPALPSESLVESQSSTAVPSCPPFDHASSATGSSKDPTGDIAKCDNHASIQSNANFQPEETVFNFTGQEVETAHQPSISLCPDALDTTNPKDPGTDDFFASISIAESKGPEPVVPGGASELLNSDQPFSTLGTSIPTISSTIATSSPAPILSQPLDTVLTAPNSPQTPTITESSTLPPDSPSLKSDCLLPDPECSFYFEPSSPASSPEPLPSLPTSLTLQLDSTDSGPTPKAVSPGELPRSEDSGTSVFKWHTVLPPPEPYIDTSFSTFQPTPQTLPLVSISSPLFPVQTPSHPEQQTFATPPPDPAPSFQENEQSLPFPAELSPLALQLPLSPTFSALDGDGLSPTPSLTDLVHFFSTDDDLGMGVDFSNTEAVPVPCPPPSKIEANTREPSCQVQPFPANKPYKHKKKSRRRKPAMTDLDQKMDDSTYTKLQPNLEEVEEQLFISFTSKEALKLHVVDSSEEVVSQPQTTSEGHLQQSTDAPENDKSMEVGGSSLPDSIHPNNFPAKLWRLVNNTANKAICWDSQGEVITIDQNLFERHVLSQSTITSDDADAFKTTNFTSFVRQLNLYGFRKADPVNKDDHHPSKDRGAYHRFYNSNFRRNHPELVANLKRLTVNNKAKLQAGLNVNCRPRFQRSSEVDDGRDENMKQESASSLEEKIAAFEKILLRDLKLMRHRQVIHPVLQEVGLKMNLLDPTLAIDLQYLGVRLPIPPPGVPLEPLTQELPPSQAVCAAFVSRTGKTTDVTQIKGWREKFTPTETPPTAAPPKPEAGPSSDLPKKNLSAFCSDMLDEYLENEGKLIDERAASFSQPVVEPVVYELPTRSTSYVRTLDNVLKKQTSSSPTLDLISGFVPPSKRPKLGLKEARTSRRENMKQRSPKHRSRPEPATGLSSAHSNLDPKQAEVQIPNSLSPQPPVFTKRKKLKPKTLSQTLTPFRSPVPPPGLSEDMAPLESDSELVTAVGPSDEAVKKNGRPTMTRTLLKQKDLEDGVVWEGRPRTSITEERAAIALTSLFTQTGFVSENPTAPIQLVRRRAPPCLNDFCRLGCVCSSLSHCSRISHCGRPSCMFGCSCLKQKVVLLKNLDGSDSSPSHQGNDKKRKRKRRMKMAYILKEAESVSQPAERVQILWKRGDGNSDPDPIHVPKQASRSRPTERREEHSSCARVRGYRGRKKTQKQKQKESSKDVKTKNPRLKRVKHRDLTLKETMNKPSSSPPGEPAQPALSDQPPSPPAEPAPKPSKRLIILAECKWASDSDRSHVLKNLCERMAWDQLDEPFWIKNYLISPIGQTVEESGADHCIQYKIHISTPKLGPDKPAKPAQGKQRAANQQQDHLEQVVREAEPPEDWQQEVEDEGAEPLEYWQQEVEEEGAEPPEDWQQEVEEEGAEPPEDWQREVEEDDIEEEPGPTLHQVHDGRASSREEMIMRSKKTMDCMALPLLTGISPAGFLSANKKQPGGTDHVVQVNAKLYPLAKIQLGKMGALHPANRLAAYLTGRVGSNRKQPGSSSSPIPPPTPLAVSQASPMVSGLAPPPRSQPAVTVLPPPNPAAGQPAPGTVGQSAASSGQRAGEAPEGAGSKVVTVRVFPGPPGGASQVSVAPGASRSSAPASDSVVPAQKGSQLLFVQVPGPGGKLLGPAPRLPPPASTAQRMVLQPVQMGSGVQYYRRPDGKLVQLVPISQLRSANQSPAVQRGSSSPSLPPAASRQTPLVTVGSQTPPVTPSPLSVPPLAPSRFLAPKGSCTFRLLPPSSSRDPIVVTCAKAPPRPLAKVVAPGSFTLFQPGPPATPMNLISLKASAGRGAELGVKTVSVSAAPVGPGGLLAHQEPTTPQTAPANQPATGTNHRQAAPPPPEVTLVPLPPPPADNSELACDPVDLDIICVDDDMGLVTTETEVGGAKPSLDEETAASSETENSSDFCDETDSDGEKKPMKTVQRHNHNQLEKQRRAKMLQLFESLRREVGLSEERTSKINTLNKAVQVIQQLRMTETDLQVRKRRLIKRRDGFLNCIIPTAEESRQVSSPEPQTGSEGPGVTDETEEVTDNSSDEERVVAKANDDVTKAEGGVQSVAMETEKKQQQKDRGSITKDPEGGLSSKKLLNARSIRDAFRALSSAVSAADAPKTAVLKQAYQEIQNLKREEERLRSLKICLKQQRDAYVRDVSFRSGKSELRILRKLQHLSSKQSQMERQLQTANQLPAAAGGGASDSPGGDVTDDDIIIISSNQQQQTPQAPPTPASAPPTSSPVQQPHSHLQRVPQASNPNPPPPAASHNASVLWNRPRTVPNILSRRRNPVLPSPLPNTVEESASFQALVPAEVLSLVGAVLPGQQVLTLSPLMAGPTVLQTSPTPGVASVTLNFPNLTNQQLHLASLPRPPPAANFNNLLQLVQPSTTQQQRTQQQQHPEHQQVPAGEPPPPQVVSAGSDQIKDQDAPPSSSLGPGLSAGPRAEVTGGGPVGQEQQEDPDKESLTSLLDELVFLNQQTGRQEEDHAHSPWLLQLDSDSDEAVATETMEAGLNDHAETTQSGPQPGPANGGVLAPPPLLQMKVGGAKVEDPTSSDGAAGGEEGGGAGGREGGVAWRPMPRLVPLGLRGNPPS